MLSTFCVPVHIDGNSANTHRRSICVFHIRESYWYFQTLSKVTTRWRLPGTSIGKDCGMILRLLLTSRMRHFCILELNGLFTKHISPNFSFLRDKERPYCMSYPEDIFMYVLDTVVYLDSFHFSSKDSFDLHLSAMADDETTVEIDLTKLLPSNSTSPDKQQISLAKARALLAWLQAYHFPTLCRRTPQQQLPVVQVTSLEAGWLRLVGAESLKWETSIHSIVKKVVVEDLGNWNASTLLASIPESDSEGRGLHDLQETSRKLSIKIVFDDDTGHIFLVGNVKKLEKKCFVIRNILSHYHWRLSGTGANVFTSK